MDLVSMTPNVEAPPIFAIPDADPQQYEALDISRIADDEPLPLEADAAIRIEAPGATAPGEGLQMRRRRLRRFIVYNRRTGYIYYWYWCYV
jgi:hypothetical protein